jgi:hypothetical protein
LKNQYFFERKGGGYESSHNSISGGYLDGHYNYNNNTERSG